MRRIERGNIQIVEQSKSPYIMKMEEQACNPAGKFQREDSH